MSDQGPQQPLSHFYPSKRTFVPSDGSGTPPVAILDTPIGPRIFYVREGVAWKKVLPPETLQEDAADINDDFPCEYASDKARGEVVDQQRGKGLGELPPPPPTQSGNEALLDEFTGCMRSAEDVNNDNKSFTHHNGSDTATHEQDISNSKQFPPLSPIRCSEGASVDEATDPHIASEGSENINRVNRDATPNPQLATDFNEESGTNGEIKILHPHIVDDVADMIDVSTSKADRNDGKTDDDLVNIIQANSRRVSASESMVAGTGSDISSINQVIDSTKEGTIAIDNPKHPKVHEEVISFDEDIASLVTQNHPPLVNSTGALNRRFDGTRKIASLQEYVAALTANWALPSDLKTYLTCVFLYVGALVAYWICIPKQES
jgi:hypothetical protein